MILNTEIQFAERMRHIPESFIREILKVSDTPEMISFAGGLPNPAFFPIEAIARAAEKVLSSEGSKVLQYSVTEGYLPLREYIAWKQSQQEGIEIAAEDVLMLSGSQQGIDLMGKLFLNIKSKLLLEGPSYLGAIQAFAAYQPTFQEVPIHKGGLDPMTLRHALEADDPSLFYFVPNYQNPTGNVHDLEVRQATAESNSNTILVEDNPYGDIWFERHEFPNLHALAPKRTVYLGSFSKTVSPGIRIGWATGPKEVLKKMTIAKQASDLHTNYFAQRTLFQYLLDNPIEQHLKKIRKFYKQQAGLMVSLIERHFPEGTTVIKPKGGMFVWLELPGGRSAHDLLQESVKKNVIFVPGQNFFVHGNGGRNAMRLNFSNPSAAEMERGISILGNLLAGSSSDD